MDGCTYVCMYVDKLQTTTSVQNIALQIIQNALKVVYWGCQLFDFNIEFDLYSKELFL